MVILAAFAFAALFSTIVIFPSDGTAHDKRNESSNRPSASRRVSPVERELARLRADVITKMKESRAGAEKLLILHEEKKKQLASEYEQRRTLYYQGLISRAEVIQIEHALAEAIIRVEEDKRWLAESEIAITEASLREELVRLPGLAIGGYSETGPLIRFNGGTLWSLADAPKLEKFFFDTFGRALPISAFGQTATHDRLRFDHRNALDVAIHPDSTEGRSLLAYLRQAGIPFIAFRNAKPGAATGAHIHIGLPSLRNQNP